MKVKFEFGKLSIISLLLLGLLLAIVWPYLHVSNIFVRSSLQIAPPNKIVTIPHWHLIFDDEFNEASLDASKWNVENKYTNGYQNCCLNYGLQLYTPSAIYLSNGILNIKTSRSSVKSFKYTSGAITTENKFSFLYGRIDVRAKLPDTQAVWPAIWLLPHNSTSSPPFEIDVMELLGQNPTVGHFTNHWGKNQVYTTYQGPNFSQGYHVFSVVWTPKVITWYIDGIEVFETFQGVSNEPMYLIINTALGGHWSGNPDGSTVLPQYMSLDYVRIYQQN